MKLFLSSVFGAILSLLRPDKFSGCEGENAMSSLEQLKNRIETLPTPEISALTRWLAARDKSRVQPETFRLLYKEYGDQVRHFSTVRSALTTFLVTVSLAAFSAFFGKDPRHPFLIVAGFILLIAAVVACLTFSFRTEKAVLRYKEVWSYLKGEKPMDVEVLPMFQPKAFTVWRRVAKDPMNWLLLAASAAIVIAFYLREQLEPFLKLLKVF